MATWSGAGRRVVLFPFPYQGHLNPMLRLAAALHARGLAVTVLHTEFRAPDQAQHPAVYRFVPVPADVPPELPASEDVARVVTSLNAICTAPFKDRLAALLSEGKGGGGGVRCVITDVIWFLAQAASRELGVPALGLMTSSAASLRTFMAYPTLLEKGYLPVKESEKEAPVHELPPFRVKDLQRIDTSSLPDFAGLPAILRPNTQYVRRHRGPRRRRHPRGHVHPDVRSRPAQQVRAVGKIKSVAAGPRVPRVAGHAGARHRALRELREPRRR
uniref:Bx9 n=1 Tax=Arundo donax TaxID=35708 RepID=A0A0A9FME5_ARUDO